MRFTMTDEKHPIYDAYRIVASESSKTHQVAPGDLGGYIAKKENLDENSDAWIFDDSVVLGNSLVSGSTEISKGAILNNVSVGYDSMISGVPVSDITFGNKVRVYGTDQSIIIADKDLTFGAVSAKRYNENSSDIYVGYSQFVGTIDEFETYLSSGKISGSDTELLQQYLPVMKRRFEK